MTLVFMAIATAPLVHSGGASAIGFTLYRLCFEIFSQYFVTIPIQFSFNMSNIIDIILL